MVMMAARRIAVCVCDSYTYACIVLCEIHINLYKKDFGLEG